MLHFSHSFNINKVTLSKHLSLYINIATTLSNNFAELKVMLLEKHVFTAEFLLKMFSKS